MIKKTYALVEVLEEVVTAGKREVVGAGIKCVDVDRCDAEVVGNAIRVDGAVEEDNVDDVKLEDDNEVEDEIDDDDDDDDLDVVEVDMVEVDFDRVDVDDGVAEVDVAVPVEVFRVAEVVEVVEVDVLDDRGVVVEVRLRLIVQRRECCPKECT